jgi:hypothetical protein
MEDLGVASYCLGLEISQDLAAQTIRISQKKYFQGVLKRFGMADCRAVSTPFPVGMKLSKDISPKTEEERGLMAGKDYLGLLDYVMYGMLGTCPDLAFALGVGNRFSSNPGIEHWNALVHLLRYIKDTGDIGITYRGPSRLSTSLSKTLLCYTDVNWAGDRDKLRSTSGILPCDPCWRSCVMDEPPSERHCSIYDGSRVCCWQPLRESSCSCGISLAS